MVSNLRVKKAARLVVVDHADRVHEGMDGLPIERG
jgi:hypothetical protein